MTDTPLPPRREPGHSHTVDVACTPEKCTGHPHWTGIRSGEDGTPVQLVPTGDAFDEFAADPFGYVKGQPEPDEETEAYAREMRTLFIALGRQGFTEHQALAIIGQTIAAMFQTAAGSEKDES